MREGVRDMCLDKHTQAGLFTDLTAGAGVTECFYMSTCACVQSGVSTDTALDARHVKHRRNKRDLDCVPPCCLLKYFRSIPLIDI